MSLPLKRDGQVPTKTNTSAVYFDPRLKKNPPNRKEPKSDLINMERTHIIAGWNRKSGAKSFLAVLFFSFKMLFIIHAKYIRIHAIS